MSGGRRGLGPIALALVIGVAGGYVANQIDLPLAWMIGAMLFVTVAALARLPVALPPRLRAVMIALLGVMLGSAFTPDLLGRAGDWWITLSALLVYSAVVGGACFVLFRRWAGYDRPTAYFAAMPGGLLEMTLLAQENGGDDRVVALVHTARVMLIVLTIPFWFRMVEGYDAARRTAEDLSLVDAPLAEMAILALIGYAGAVGARIVRLPATYLIGPMVASAIAHLLGWTTFRPPAELVTLAQVVVGAAIGCRFAGIAVMQVLRTLGHAAGATAIMLAGTIVASALLHQAVDAPTPALVLAFAPGGLAEMSLVALALATDAAFVSTHHVVRIAYVVVVAPFVYRMLRKLQR